MRLVDSAQRLCTFDKCETALPDSWDIGSARCNANLGTFGFDVLDGHNSGSNGAGQVCIGQRSFLMLLDYGTVALVGVPSRSVSTRLGIWGCEMLGLLPIFFSVAFISANSFLSALPNSSRKISLIRNISLTVV